MQSMSNLERWFAQKMVNGDRNNTYAKYAFLLMDCGYNLNQIREMVLSLNKKLSNPLDENELENTILTSVRNRQIN